MKKATDQLKAEFTALMQENGFSKTPDTMYDGRPIYARVWVKEVEVAWYGKQESRLEIKLDEAHGIPQISIYKNNQLQSRRGYSSPKRAINAMREIVNYAGFEF